MYVMSFGLALAMNGWLGTYYREAFDDVTMLQAATFAATFSIAVGLLRPLGGYVSDRVARSERNLLPLFRGQYREQWTFVTLAFLLMTLFGLTAAGLTGSIYLTLAAAFAVGVGCALSAGAIFAQVPVMFPDSSGSVAGIVGGAGTIGGVVYPLVFAAPFLSNLHLGYGLTALTMVPILVLAAWVFQPHVAETAAEVGLLDGAPDGLEPADD